MKKFNFKSLADKVIPVAEMGVGFAAAKVVPAVINKVSKSQTGLSNTIVGGAQIVVGIFISTLKNKHLANVGLGVAISGAHTFLANPVNKALEAAGLNGTIQGYNFRPNEYSVGCPGDSKTILK